jgi:hypothetical protein
VLRPQPVEAVSADAGDQVPADGRLVALQRPLSHAARGDGRQPVLEPCTDGRGGRLADRPGVALALELSDLRDHDAAALAADVPAVELAAEREPDGDVAVPTPVGALVDRRLAVRRASRHPLPLGALPKAQSGGPLSRCAGALWIHAASGGGCGPTWGLSSRFTYRSSSAWVSRQLRPMCTRRSRPPFMSAYTVVRPTRRTFAASSGVGRSRSAARTSGSGCGSPMSTSPGSVACHVEACARRWGSGLPNICSTSPADEGGRYRGRLATTSTTAALGFWSVGPRSGSVGRGPGVCGASATSAEPGWTRGRGARPGR